jgi:hypothetical protein
MGLVPCLDERVVMVHEARDRDGGIADDRLGALSERGTGVKIGGSLAANQAACFGWSGSPSNYTDPVCLKNRSSSMQRSALSLPHSARIDPPPQLLFLKRRYHAARARFAHTDQARTNPEAVTDLLPLHTARNAFDEDVWSKAAVIDAYLINHAIGEDR